MSGEFSFIAAQIIGFAVMLLSIVSVQFKRIGLILGGELFVNVLSAASYILLGGDSGGWICFAAIFQTLVSYIYERAGRKLPNIVTGFFIAVYIMISAYNYTDYNDVLSCLCAVFFALAIVQDAPEKYRRLKILNVILWLVYDFNTMAYSLMITHGMIMLSTLFAMIKFDLKKVKTEKNDTK